MGTINELSTIWINSNLEAVWNAVTDDEKLSQWYVPGSPWQIPKLKVGKEVIFTLMPSIHNQLTKELPMSLTIKKVKLFEEFSLYLESQKLLISFRLVEESEGTIVTINSAGFNQSLENLKAFLEGEELPFV